ncbi:MAG: hypothetical protein JJ896_07115 [Rhodothermales bacterium]|nr:hypothetical protein [Rhodothermales bacterium]MBO6779407.1 hypothetical protein [Rhodothermales bacterium]
MTRISPSVLDVSRQPAGSARRKAYKTPVLTDHGNLDQLTKAEYGGLDQLLFGSLFAMASPGLPSAPSR